MSEIREVHTFVVSVLLDERAVKYIKSFKGLKGIPEEFCEGVIVNALKSTMFFLDHDISVEFRVSKEQITYPEPY